MTVDENGADASWRSSALLTDQYELTMLAAALKDSPPVPFRAPPGVALGEAVAKINHDLKNMLTGAQLASERLAALKGQADFLIAISRPPRFWPACR